MGIKSVDPDIFSVHTYWDSPEGYKCPLCGKKIDYAFNDGGRNLVTMKGLLWIVTNYYRCVNDDCDLHKAFPMVHESVIKNKKFGKDVWERVVRYHFKTHLDYKQIQELLWDDTDVSISKTTIRNIINHFEQAGVAYLDAKIRKDIKDLGYMIVSLDGAQPKAGHPALWIFTERLTRHTIKAELLDSATAPILSEILKDLEEKFGVPIKAVISDKQKNIVNAVKEFNPSIPHVYCQYHFLNHIMEPIQAKDSHIATQLRKEIRKFSIVANLSKGYLSTSNNAYNKLYEVLAPLAEELLNAISVSGRKWEILPGKEIYENVLYITSQIDSLDNMIFPKKIKNSINSVQTRLNLLLMEFKPTYDDIIHLLDDSADLRKELAKKRRRSKSIKKAVKTWVYRLQSRLKRRNLEYNPINLKYKLLNYNSTEVEIWQQWIRLEWSYHDGLYYSYDSPELEKTNNATEQLINRTKRHFKKWLGQQDIQTVFEHHSASYAQLIELEYSPEQINEILWKQSVAIIPGNITPLECFQATIRRDWHIRTKNSGNFDKLKKNIDEYKFTNL